MLWNELETIAEKIKHYDEVSLRYICDGLPFFDGTNLEVILNNKYGVVF